MEDPATTPNLNPKPLFNPSKKDFTWHYLDDDLMPCTATVHSMQITYLPTWIADRVAHHLAEHLMWERGIKQNATDDIQNILKEIEVTV